MVKNTAGSALIWVLMLFALVSLLGTITLNSVMWAGALPQVLYEKEQLNQFAQGAFDCTVARAKKDFDTICKNKKIITGTIFEQDIEMQLQIEPTGKGLQVLCYAKKAGALPVIITGQLVKDNHNQIRLCCFQR